jgi:hypothetical protein
VSDKQSLGTMISGVTQDLSTLIRGEIELAKTELKETARTASKGGGLLVGAAVLAGTGGLFLLLTLAWLLDVWLPTWAAFGIVTLMLIIVAVILGLLGRKELEAVQGPTVSPESIEKTKAVLSRKPLPTAAADAGTDAVAAAGAAASPVAKPTSTDAA